MAQIKTSELPTADSLDYAVGIKDGVTSKAPISGGGVIYSSEEHKVGKWFDDDLYEKTLVIDTSSWKKNSQNIVDVSSVGATFLKVDINNSFFYRYVEAQNFKIVAPILYNNGSPSTTYVTDYQYIITLLSNKQDAINFWYGNNGALHPTLYLTIQYTK